MKIWVDDVRQAPTGWQQARSVNEAKVMIEHYETLHVATANDLYKITKISLDHDAGDYAKDGGDYIKLLDWLEETGRKYPIHIHTANPVGAQNMRRIIQRNRWIEVQ